MSSAIKSITSDSSSPIYNSLLIPFSADPTDAELAYQAAHLQKTKGTLFILPPSEEVLRSTYHTAPRAKTRMSSGAVALCKHFERIPDSPRLKRDQAGDQRHPYWTEPRGSNENKTLVASQILNDMLAGACWRNVMLLHRGVAVYEIRNAKGWGMRWTLGIEGDGANQTARPVEDVMNENLRVIDKDEIFIGDVNAPSATELETQDRHVVTLATDEEDPNNKVWKIKSVSFRGFLEPIEGMNHELLEQSGVQT